MGCLLCLAGAPQAGASQTGLPSPTAILIDAETGYVLLEKRADRQSAADSLSHLMIVLLRRENAPFGSGQKQVGAGCQRRNWAPAACAEFGRFGPKRV